jgi:hypothetical protein
LRALVSGAHAFLVRELTSFPSSAPEEHRLSSVRPLAEEETSANCRTDQAPRSDAVPRRTTPFRGPDAFYRREPQGVRRITPSAGSCVGLSLTPPTRFPLAGERCLVGTCKRRPCGSPRAGAFERASAFFTCRLVIPCLDLTTQARPQARSAWSVARAVCLARAYAGRSASTASTTESSWRAGL